MRPGLEGAQPGARAIVFGLGAAPAGAMAPAEADSTERTQNPL
jgi:hypothetical protein